MSYSATEKLERNDYLALADYMRGLKFIWSPFVMAFIGSSDPTSKLTQSKAA